MFWDLASTTRVEVDGSWLACAPHGSLYRVRLTGPVAGGGAFESDYRMLLRHAQGRATHLEMFELHDVDTALARFEALRAASE